MAEIGEPFPYHAPWSPYAKAAISHLNSEISKARLLSTNNGGRNREVDVTGPFELWEEITRGWNHSPAYAAAQLEGVRLPRPCKQAKVYVAGEEVSKVVHSAELFLGHPLLYFILQLEAFSESCAGPSKELPSKDFLVVHRLECIFLKTSTFSPDFFVEKIRFKVSFCTLHHQTPDPESDSNFLSSPCTQSLPTKCTQSLPTKNGSFPSTSRLQSELLPCRFRSGLVTSAFAVGTSTRICCNETQVA